MAVVVEGSKVGAYQRSPLVQDKAILFDQIQSNTVDSFEERSPCDGGDTRSEVGSGDPTKGNLLLKANLV